MTEPEGYSSKDERKRHKKEKKEKRRAERILEAQEHEPRHFSREQRSFANRLEEGMSMLGGGD